MNATRVIAATEGLSRTGSTVINARIRREDADALRRYCEAKGTTPSEWIRRMVRAELDRAAEERIA